MGVFPRPTCGLRLPRTRSLRRVVRRTLRQYGALGLVALTAAQVAVVVARPVPAAPDAPEVQAAVAALVGEAHDAHRWGLPDGVTVPDWEQAMALLAAAASARQFRVPGASAPPPPPPGSGGDGSVTLSAMAGAPSTTTYVPDGRSTGTATLPRTWLTTAMVPVDGTVWDVTADFGGSPQAALDAVATGTIQGGDAIEFEASSTGTFYDGNYTLRERAFDGNGVVLMRGSNPWIVLRTKRHAELPAEGTKPAPLTTHAGVFAALRTSSIASPLQTKRMAGGKVVCYYRLVGLELTQVPGTGVAASRMLNFGDPGGSSYNVVDDIPQFLIADRCYIHGIEGEPMGKAIGLHARSDAIVDCWVEDVGAPSYESQAIEMVHGPGPHKIVGNTLIGATETVMSGGGDSAIAGARPSDIEFRRNDVTKWAKWNPRDLNYDGSASQRVIKNLFELKNAQYVLVEGNVFRHIWPAAQTGAAFLLKSVNQGGKTTGSGPTSKTTDVVVRFNRIEYAENCFAMAGAPSPPVEEPLSRVLVEHNIGLRIGTAWTQYGSGQNSQDFGAFFVNNGPVIDQDVRWNTVIATERGIFSTGSQQNVRGGFVGNVFGFGNNATFGGIQDDGTPDTAQGMGSFQYFWPDGEWIGNLIYDVPSAKLVLFDQTNDNVVLTTQAAVGFVDPASDNYRITPGSTYADRGADWDAVAAYTAGVRDAAVPSPS